MIENRVVMYVDVRSSRSHLSSQLGPCARTLKRENFQLLVGFTSVARRSQLSHYIFHCCVVNDKIWADSHVWRLWNAVVFCFSKRLFCLFWSGDGRRKALAHLWGISNYAGEKKIVPVSTNREKESTDEIFVAGLAQNILCRFSTKYKTRFSRLAGEH